MYFNLAPYFFILTLSFICSDLPEKELVQGREGGLASWKDDNRKEGKLRGCWKGKREGERVSWDGKEEGY